MHIHPHIGRALAAERRRDLLAGAARAAQAREASRRAPGEKTDDAAEVVDRAPSLWTGPGLMRRAAARARAR